MGSTIREMRGTQILSVRETIASLRIRVFRDWPCLYDRDPAYERKYLTTYAKSSRTRRDRRRGGRCDDGGAAGRRDRRVAGLHRGGDRSVDSVLLRRVGVAAGLSRARTRTSLFLICARLRPPRFRASPIPRSAPWGGHRRIRFDPQAIGARRPPAAPRLLSAARPDQLVPLE